MKRRLALPKNVVLLSLIQATELASKDARQKYSESPRRSGDSDEAIIGPSTADLTPHGATLTTSGTTTPTPHNSTAVLMNGVANIATGPSIPDLKSRGSMLDMEEEEEDEEEEEEEKIKISTSLAVGKAGTYAVACRDGLQIYPSRPSSWHGSTTENFMPEEDVESIVRVYHIDQANSSREDDGENHHIMHSNLMNRESLTPKADETATTAVAAIAKVSSTVTSNDVAPTTTTTTTDDTDTISSPQQQQQSSVPPPPPPPPPLSISERLRNKKDPVKLRYGDRIQVVSVDGGWAKLARGYGFVRAEKNHIVKGNVPT
jgi:hypothetical protein